jgi:pilus assembly protein CpaE
MKSRAEDPSRDPSRMGNNGIVVVTGEASTADEVAAAVEMKLEPQGVCTDIDRLSFELERGGGRPRVVVVDIDPEPARMLSELDPVIGRFPDTRFIVLSRELNNEWLLRAMQAGARHYMTKQAIRSELSGVIDRIIPSNGGWAHEAGAAGGTGIFGPSYRGGGIITVASAGGGCGATMLAVNLANELRMVAEAEHGATLAGRALVIDLDCCYGGVSSHLGLNGQFGLDEVLCEGRPIDAELIRSTAVRHDEGLDVLMSPAASNPGEPVSLDFSQLGRLLRVARQSYTWVIVDAPRLPTDVLTTLALASMTTLLTLELNVEHIRTAKAMLARLLQHNALPETLMPVANRHRRRYGLVSLQDAQRALGVPKLTALSNDYTAVEASVNYGRTLAKCAPRSALRREIRDLAASMSKAYSLNGSAGKEF